MIRAVKKTWVAEEDKALMRLIDVHGLTNWSLIAASMESRTGKQCRERYFNHLQPNIKKGNWTDEEDQIIISMQAKIGNQWSAMTKYLPGRTDNAIKNRWHAIVKAQTQQENPNIPQQQTGDHIIMHDNRKNINHQFTYKMPMQQHMTSGYASYFGTTPNVYMPQGTTMRNYTPFEPPSETDQDNSTFKPSQMPANQMNVLPAFDTLMSRVADSNTSNPNDASANVSLDFLSYFFEKELENKDTRNENGDVNISNTFFFGDGNIGADGSESTSVVSSLSSSINPGVVKEDFPLPEESCGLIFDFSRVSLDFTLDDCGATNLGEYDINLPSPASYKKNLTVNVPLTEDYSYLTVPLSHRPRTPRSPVLLDMKRTRF